MLSLVPGFAVGLSLIVAIGAQNVFVLRQGLRREHVWPVVVACAASDAVLITVGVAGIGHLDRLAPWAEGTVRWAGAAFLLAYAALAARRALRPGAGDALASSAGGPVPGGPGPSGALAVRRRATPVVLSALALTWLNPHVYLDTVFLLGSIASGHGPDRWWFAAGAVTASITWFAALGGGSRWLAPLLASPRSWRVLDGAVAAVMVTIAITLVR